MEIKNEFMYLKQKVTVLCCTLLTAITFAQDAFYKKYDWSETPEYIENLVVDVSKDIIKIKDKRVKEFAFIDKNGLIEYALTHKVFWLNSDEKIEEHNKVYLPYAINSQLMISKARVVTKEGKIIELDESKILTATDDETKRAYKYFALEGVEKESFIEYWYVVKKYPTYTGRRIVFQDENEARNINFDLYAPKNLIFKFKSYNGLPLVEKDTLSKDKNHWTLQVDALKGVKKEGQSPYLTTLQSLIYKLDYNTVTKDKGVVSYAKASQNVYNSFHPEMDKKTKNALQKFVKELPVKEESTLKEKVRTIENYIKSTIFISEVKKEGLGDLATIIKDKVANQEGIIRVYVAIFEALKIKYQVVLTSDRKNKLFDKEFEAYNFLEDYLLYFPKLKMYTSPHKLESRLGFPPGYYTDNYGLFIREVSLSDFKSGVGKIKYIKPVSHKETKNNMKIDLKIDANDITKAYIDFELSYSGYYGAYIQPFAHLMKKDDREEIIENYIKNVSKNVEIIEKEMLNANPESFGILPLIIKAKVESEHFIEKAGKKYLFKMGELIGPQSELYQKEKRELALMEEFKRSYDRVLKIEIPKGYKISNPDVINIDNSYKNDGTTFFKFKSSYIIEGNIMTVNVDEFYNLNTIPVELYEEYRTVINSAANFNKVVLVLEKI